MPSLALALTLARSPQGHQMQCSRGVICPSHQTPTERRATGAQQQCQTAEHLDTDSTAPATPNTFAQDTPTIQAQGSPTEPQDFQAIAASLPPFPCITPPFPSSNSFFR